MLYHWAKSEPTTEELTREPIPFWGTVSHPSASAFRPLRLHFHRDLRDHYNRLIWYPPLSAKTRTTYLLPILHPSRLCLNVTIEFHLYSTPQHFAIGAGFITTCFDFSPGLTTWSPPAYWSVASRLVLVGLFRAGRLWALFPFGTLLYLILKLLPFGMQSC